MNVLLDSLPTAADINGTIVEFNTNYKVALKVLTALDDPLLTHKEKAYIVIKLLYKSPENIPDFTVAYEKAITFLNAGYEPDDSLTPVKKTKKKLYSFEQDAKYIYMAIDRVLDGAISRGDQVHWWVFSLAFNEIPEDCTLSRIISLRSKKARGKLSKEEKRVYKEMRDILDLDEHLPEAVKLTEEQEANQNEFLKELMKGDANV